MASCMFRLIVLLTLLFSFHPLLQQQRSPSTIATAPPSSVDLDLPLPTLSAIAKLAASITTNDTKTSAVITGATEEGREGKKPDGGAFSCPASCFLPIPVCGVDGVTYWCGAADAECAGVLVGSVGFCDLGSIGSAGRGVVAVQSLLLIHMIWLPLAGLLVLFGLPRTRI